MVVWLFCFLKKLPLLDMLLKHANHGIKAKRLQTRFQLMETIRLCDDTAVTQDVLTNNLCSWSNGLLSLVKLVTIICSAAYNFRRSYQRFHYTRISTRYTSVSFKLHGMIPLYQT